tara:strand:- start:916 stop:1398 length:483 start_codon:yes stop_codon:yes gene_type:complete
MNRMKKISKLMPNNNLNIFTLFCILLFTACSKDINVRGNLPDDGALSQLKPGNQTRQDVEEILGTPSHKAIFDNEKWFYISSQTTQFAFYAIEELNRNITVVEFDQRGILKNISNLNIKDGKNIDVSDRVTPTMGRDYSLIEQLIGNLGRFDRGKPEAGP